MRRRAGNALVPDSTKTRVGQPFVRIARSIRESRTECSGYLHERLANGIVEGFNNRLRIARHDRHSPPL